MWATLHTHYFYVLYEYKKCFGEKRGGECVGGSWKLRPRFSSTIKEIKDEFSYKEINYNFFLIKAVEIYTCVCVYNIMRMCKNSWGKKADENVCSNDKD